MNTYNRFREYELEAALAETKRDLAQGNFVSSLHLNKLSEKLNELYSVLINISYRVTLEFIISEKTIIPVKVGTHDEVYR
jgi:plasmid maintenance system killer protein